MMQKRLLLNLVKLFVVFLILGAFNHCIFEELFFSLSKSVSITEPTSNHAASSSKHKHDDTSDTHEHGQPHAVFILHIGKNLADFVKILNILLPLALFFIFANLSIFYKRSCRTILAYVSSDPFKQLRHFISSLTFAPQAPPSFAYYQPTRIIYT